MKTATLFFALLLTLSPQAQAGLFDKVSGLNPFGKDKGGLCEELFQIMPEAAIATVPETTEKSKFAAVKIRALSGSTILSGRALAGIDKVSARASEGYDNLSARASEGFDKASERAAERIAKLSGSAAENFENLRVTVVNGLETASDIKKQIADLTCTVGNCSVTYGKTMGKEMPKTLWRTWRFDGGADDIRTQIVVPMAGLLRDIRMHRDSGDNVALSEALAKMTLLSITAPIMLQKSLPQQVLSISPMNMALGVAIPTVQWDQGPLLDQVAIALRVAVVKSVKDALTAQGLTFSERLALFEQVRQAYELDILPQVAKRMGWNDLGAEIENWRRKNPEDETD